MAKPSRGPGPQYFFAAGNEPPFGKLTRDRKIALFLDFDGTLVPIMENPAECFLSERIKKQLRSLANSERVRLTIMSGRSLSDVRMRVGIRKIYYSGNHGFEIAGPGLTYTHARAVSNRPLMKDVKDRLKSEVTDIEGAWLEDKKFTLSLHFRTVEKERVRSLMKRFYRVAGEFLENKSLGVIMGKKVLELTPDPLWNKGRAVLWMLGRFKIRCLPVYVGDDETDEEAFTALRKTGIAVRVGRSRSTSAKYYLEGLWEISQLLERVEEYIAV